jgi:hypothetical protein
MLEMTENGKYDWADVWFFGTFFGVPLFCIVGILWFLTHW